LERSRLKAGTSTKTRLEATGRWVYAAPRKLIENSLAGATGEASEFHPIPNIDV
jgi:hypothetical protein